MVLDVLAACCLAVHGTPLGPHASGDPVRVFEHLSGCEAASVDRAYEWEDEGDHYRLEGRTFRRALVEEVRRLVLASTSGPPDLLAQVGFTPGAVAAHRKEILESAWPRDVRAWPDRPRELPPEIWDRVPFEGIAKDALDHLLTRGWWRTTQREFRVTLPGSPVITVHST